MAKNRLKGGLADGMKPSDIANKHNVDIEVINSELRKGIKDELEHTKDRGEAMEIALDHLFTDPKYYTNLNEMNQRDFIKKLLKENIAISITDETNDSTTYDIMYKGRYAGEITCGPAPTSLGDDAHQILNLKLDDEYTDLNTAFEGVRSLWDIYPETNKLVIEVPKISRLFWEKLGFNRLNDKFHILFRGH